MRNLLLSLCFCMPAALCAQQAVTVSPAPKTPLADRAKELCKIEGRVINVVTGEPLRRVTLTLHSTAARAASGSAVTNAEGHFLLEDVEPGTYRLFAERTGFLGQEYGARSWSSLGTPLSLSAGQDIKDLEFKLTPQGLITGKVLDEEGEPVKGVDVIAFRPGRHGSTRSTAGGAEASTNDLGEFRIPELGPGNYLLAADRPAPGVETSRPKSGQPEEAYVPTFYPGVTELPSAMPVQVAAGQEVSRIDIRMRKTQVYRLRGEVVGVVAAQPERNIQLLLVPREPSEAMLGFTRGSAKVKADGTFEIRGVLPGSYHLAALGRMEKGPQIVGRLPVEVGNSDVEGLIVSAGAGLEITGSVRLEGGQKTNLQGVTVYLQAAEGMPSGSNSARVKDDGTFSIEGVSRDKYHLSLYPLPEGTYLKSVRVGGQEVLDKGLDLTQAVPGQALEVTLSPRAGMVEGMARAGENLAPGSFVTLVPEPIRPEQPYLYKSANADQNGRFQMQGVAPGDYKLYAWEGMELSPLQDPELVKHFESKGVKVTVRESGQEHVELTVVKQEDSQPR
jgi:protocatechuate 3,4-dioxygenase beta subunit